MSTKLKTKKHSIYNPALDQYENKDIFPEKTGKAKKALSKPGVMDFLKRLDTDSKGGSKKSLA